MNSTITHTTEIVPVIDTERLCLRAFRREDAADVYAYTRNPRVLRYTTGKTPRTLAESQAFVDRHIGASPGFFAWAIRRKDDPRVIGAVEFSISEDTAGTIDYALGEEHWNQGLMTEAATAVLDWAFRTYPLLEQVTSAALTINPASIRVMEKCGLVFQQYDREKWEKFEGEVTLAVYSISRAAWNLRHDSEGGQ